MKWSNKLAAIAAAGAQCWASNAAMAQTQWIADQNGCLHVNPMPRADERLEWSGACKGGRGQGPGELRWIVAQETIQIVKVSLVDGKAQGRGISDSPKENNRYEGEFRDGIIQGYGTLHMSKVARYDGPFERSLPHGQGTLRWRNGNRYEGTFVEGVLTGKGRLLFVNGARYEGDFVSGTIEGRGLLQRSDGSRYEGMFSRGLPTGLGLATLPDGTRYEGEFVQGKPSGVGQYRSASGDVLIPPIDATLQQHLTFLPSGVRPAPVTALNAANHCSKMAPPILPSVDWSGQATFVIQAQRRNGRIDEITVVRQHIDGVVDETVTAKLLQSITDAVMAYECTIEDGKRIQQEFVFQID